MSGVLCIDFGTSSIRAVRRQPSGRLKILGIGRVTNSRLDDASIPSEIHVDEKRRYVRFGEQAFVARKEGTPALYEASPKLWLKAPGLLGEEAAPGLGVTREGLLSGLLAYAIRAAAKADAIGESTLKNIDIRIAHPIWPEQVTADANGALVRICAKARKLAFRRNWGTVAVPSLLKLVRAPAVLPRFSADVIEPVAAASELLPEEDNSRRICVLVDVGAGTTDIGMFQCVNPEESSVVKSKLYPVGKPVSVFKAGNFVDEIVLKLLTARATSPDALALAEVRARIRGIKETLFRLGFIQELGCIVRLNDLQSHPEAIAMATEIRGEILRMVQANARIIVDFMERRDHPVDCLDVVMAGGGGSIDFLLRAIDAPIPTSQKSLPVRLTIPVRRTGVNTFGASPGRRAVALGGASQEYDALVHKQPTLTTIRLGSL